MSTKGLGTIHYLAVILHPFLLERVIDGDTIVVQLLDDPQGRTGLHVRLYGIDAPEWNQPYGREATEALQAMLAPYQGQVLYLRMHGWTYGRLLASLFFTNHPDANPYDNNICYRLVREGWAWFYSPSLKEARRRRQQGRGIIQEKERPPLEDFKTAEELARAERRGLWAEDYGGPAIEPHAFRHMDKYARRELVAQWRQLLAYRPIPHQHKKKQE